MCGLVRCADDNVRADIVHTDNGVYVDGQCCTLTTVCKCAQMAGVCMDWQQCVHGQQRVREDSMRTDDGVCICANSVCTDDSGVYMDDTIASGRYGRCVY
eukprot:Opistho-2@92049